MTDDKTAEVSKDIVTRKKDGCGTFGLFVEYVLFEEHTGRLARQERLFLARNIVSRYSRKRGEKRASWRAYHFNDHDGARAFLIRTIERRTSAGIAIQMIGTPLAVELTPADVEACSREENPYARHLGTTVNEKINGRIDDEAWAPAGKTPAKAGAKKAPLEESIPVPEEEPF